MIKEIWNVKYWTLSNTRSQTFEILSHTIETFASLVWPNVPFRELAVNIPLWRKGSFFIHNGRKGNMTWNTSDFGYNIYFIFLPSMNEKNHVRH